MKNQKKELYDHQLLNSFAVEQGTVIFGGTADREIPVGELKQYFSIEEAIYNRSISDLSVSCASEFYDACVAPLSPERVLLHIGDADIELFQQNPSAFASAYCELIRHIRSVNPECDIIVVSLKSKDPSSLFAEMNHRLRYIAESERCGFSDIAAKQVWNPREMREVISFVHSIGFVRPLPNKKPNENLVKILFLYKDGCQSVPVSHNEKTAPQISFGAEPQAMAI